MQRPAHDVFLVTPPGSGLRRWMDEHRGLVNLLFLLVALPLPTLMSVTLIAVPTGIPFGTTLWWSIPAFIIGCVTLFFRHRFPAAGTLILAVILALPGPLTGGLNFVFWALIYTLGNYVQGWRRWVTYAVAMVVSLTGALLNTLRDVPSLVDNTAPNPVGVLIVSLVSVTATAAITLVPLMIGVAVGNRRRYLSDLVTRAQELADARAGRAASDERTRIAREMHDIVSHSLTVMVTLSEGAAAQVGAGTAGDAMRTVAETGRTSLAEMRRLLGVLRSEDAVAERAPQPGDGDLDTLMQQFRDAGVPVHFRREGAAVTDRQRALSVYRILQEGLTNVLRHAPGAAEVSALLRNDGATLTIEVRNSAGTRPSTGPTGPGSGLIGARERAALHGGNLVSTAVPGGGWVLHAELPLEVNA